MDPERQIEAFRHSAATLNLPHVREIGIAALHESAQQIERGRRVAKGLDLALGIRTPRRFVEVDPVDDIAAVARQFLAVPFLHRRRARLRELAGDAADFHHRQGGGIGQHHRHLQKHAQEVADVVGADVVGAMLGEGFGAISALQQKALPCRDAAERLFQAAGLACKYKGRKRRKPPLDRGERRLIRIFGNLDDRLATPTVARPTLGHDGPPPRLNPGTNEVFQIWEPYTRGPAPQARWNCDHGARSTEETRRYSAASRRWLSAFSRSVTSSSAAVGCTAMTASISALVAFIFSAIPTS